MPFLSIIMAIEVQIMYECVVRYTAKENSMFVPWYLSSQLD
ncbi:hypothetical protein [Pseudalkalibacillus hwajinpoensis]|nr:hypothetical protein [Pseudalkalibacillus hwajinpoensis]